MNSTDTDSGNKGDINITPQFVLAGEAVFTVSNGRGEHFTFKVYSSEPTAKFPRPCWFMKVKNGPEEGDWGYLGRLDVNPDNLLRDPALLTTAKSRYSKDSPSFRTAQWALKVVWQAGRGSYRVPAGYSLRHEGRCGRCRRPLTHPASLDTGLGPECASVMGVDWGERERRQPELTRMCDRCGKNPAHPSIELCTECAKYDANYATGDSLFGHSRAEDAMSDTSHPGHPSNFGDN